MIHHRMRILSGLLPCLLSGLAWAGSITSEQRSIPYTAVVSVDATAVEITMKFTATSTADAALMVQIYNTAGDGIYCVTSGTATAVGAPLLVGQTFIFDRRTGGTAITRLSCITAAAGAATLYIWADRPK